MILDGLLEALEFRFIQNMFMAGILASIVCGIIGTYVVTKKLVFISGGIAHTTFGGIGMAYYLGWSNPLLGAVIFAVGTALSVGGVSLRTRIKEDSTIGVLWVLGMALGILFIKMTNGYVPDPLDLLFGNILFVNRTDVYIMLGLVLVILAVVAAIYKELLAMTFDEEFSKVSGVRTEGLYLVLLVLVALTVVTLLKVVGVILVIALLTIPAAISSLFTREMRRMMALAVIIGLVFTIAGILVSWETDLPPGATIVLMLGVAFIVAVVGKGSFTRLAGRVRSRRRSVT